MNVERPDYVVGVAKLDAADRDADDEQPDEQPNETAVETDAPADE
jgi:hypothetical protein